MSVSIRITVAVAVLGLLLGAGTSLAGPPGKVSSKLTLTLADPEQSGRPTSQIADAFAARVKALSHGAIAVKVVYQAGWTSDDLPTGQIEANLIGLVRSGENDVAIVPTRAFQAQGVPTFQALMAPFLITTESGMDRVTKGAVADRLQSGLGRIDLVGLGLAPEGLRRPFGFKHVLSRPADFAGSRIRAIPAKQTWALLRALGAKPVDVGGDAYTEAIRNGTIQGAESSLAIAADDNDLHRTFTAGNLAFFPKVDAIVLNRSTADGLSSEQQSILRQAAASAREWAVSHLTERNARDDFCKGGGTIFNVRGSDLAALRAKTSSLLAAMRRDPVTRGLIARLEEVGAAGSPLRACTSPVPNLFAAKGPTVTKVIPAGVYRASFTEKELVAAGATPTHAQSNAGTWTITVTKDGRQSIHIDSPYPQWTGDCPTRQMYVRSGLVAVEFRGGCNGDVWVAWKLTPAGLTFTRVVPPDPENLVVFGTHQVWKKVG